MKHGYLKYVADVDDESAGKGTHGEPFPVVLDLKSLDVVDLEEQCQAAAAVRVWREAQHLVGFGTWGIVVDPHALRHVVEDIKESVGCDPQRFSYNLHQSARYSLELR